MVLAGIASVKLAVEALAGPLLVTAPVTVNVEPAVTVGAETVFVTARSAEVATPTVVIAVAELFARLGSEVPDVILSTSTICVPFTVAIPVVTATVKFAVVKARKSGIVHVIVPVAPTAGVEQVQPTGEVID